MVEEELGKPFFFFSLTVWKILVIFTKFLLSTKVIYNLADIFFFYFQHVFFPFHDGLTRSYCQLSISLFILFFLFINFIST